MEEGNSMHPLIERASPEYHAVLCRAFDALASEEFASARDVFSGIITGKTDSTTRGLALYGLATSIIRQVPNGTDLDNALALLGEGIGLFDHADAQLMRGYGLELKVTTVFRTRPASVEKDSCNLQL